MSVVNNRSLYVINNSGRRLVFFNVGCILIYGKIISTYVRQIIRNSFEVYQVGNVDLSFINKYSRYK